jgi:hypothetical protein
VTRRDFPKAKLHFVAYAIMVDHRDSDILTVI